MDKVIRGLVFITLMMIFLGLIFFLSGSAQVIFFLIFAILCIGCSKIKYYSRKIIIGFFVIAFSVMIFSSIRNMFPFVKMLNINAGYNAIDSNWHEDRNNPYHNDVILYTILHNCVCYISRDSWYRDYFMAIGKKVVLDEKLSIQNSNDMQSELSYVNLGYSRAITNNVLFEEKYYHAILDQESKTGVAASIYLSPEGIEEKRECVILNDEKGNIYVKAR